MPPDVPLMKRSGDKNANIAANLLEGLETLREEIGSIADDIIALLRGAGVRPPAH